jgi:hypothetical protein
MQKWQEKRILILGTTYPSYSMKYTESVCTGGIEEDTLKMVRLHPIPHRYLDSDQQFSAFQWIKVKVMKHPNDSRPESYRVDTSSIELQEKIPSTQHRKRRELLENSPHLCKSVEELKDRQKANGTSLGIIIPKAINTVDIQMRGPSERKVWLEKEKLIMSQPLLSGEEIKRIDFPEAKFYVLWRCADERCEGHKMSLLQWGIHQLYRKLKDDPDCNQKISELMQKRLNQYDNDVFLFLGNFRDVQYNFGLMDSYSAPKCLQPGLFG